MIRSDRKWGGVNRNAASRTWLPVSAIQIVCRKGDSVSGSDRRLSRLSEHITVSRSGPKEASAYDDRRLPHRDLRRYVRPSPSRILLIQLGRPLLWSLFRLSQLFD